jgi:hypothetical protein
MGCRAMRDASGIMAGATVPYPDVVMWLPADDGVSTADGSVGRLGFEARGGASLPAALVAKAPLQIITGQV